MVLRIARPDGSVRTFWRARPTNDELALTELEMLPAVDAELTELDASLLAPMALPDLWVSAEQPITVASIRNHFNGENAPRLASGVLDAALRQSVAQGIVCERAGTYIYFKEQPPVEAFTDKMELLPPPAPLSPDDLLPTNFPEAWVDGQANIATLVTAVSASRGSSAPWVLISDAIASGLQSKKFEIASGPWPTSYDKANLVSLRFRSSVPLPLPPTSKNGLSAEATLTPLEVQKLGEEVGRLTSAAPALKVGFSVLITVEGNADDATVEALNKALAQVSSKLRIV